MYCIYRDRVEPLLALSYDCLISSLVDPLVTLLRVCWRRNANDPFYFSPFHSPNNQYNIDLIRSYKHRCRNSY